MLTFSAAPLLVLFVGQSGLKDIEYHMEEGSDTSFQLYQGDQVQVEGETTAVGVPVPGKIEEPCACNLVTLLYVAARPNAIGMS